MATPPYQVLNPATGELVEEFAFATDAEIEAALAKSAEAYKSWRRTSIGERAAIVKNVEKLFTERMGELAAIINEEMGKALDSAAGESWFAGAIFGYYADNAEAMLADQELPGTDGKARVSRKAVGPIIGVMPWNFPYYQVARFAGPNLMAGNTILLKHAECCPKSSAAIEQLLADAGVPDGVYINLYATHEQVATMIEDSRTAGVSLTGSERAGTSVAETAGKSLKKVVLELGGSDPYIVLDTKDPMGAAELAWRVRIENMGQACNSPKRMIITKDNYDEFVAGLVEQAKALKPRTEDPEHGYAPMVSRRAAEILHGQVQDAVSKGATLHVGGELLDDKTAFFSPAVLTGITPEMRAYKEELFGPVAMVYKVDSDDEAVELANVVEYGLGSVVWSDDAERAAKVAGQIDAGMVYINTHELPGVNLPFGGTKRSGYGRELGSLGIDEFVNKQLYYVA